MTFYVGQKVVCVDDHPGKRYAIIAATGLKAKLDGDMGGLKKGNIYTIRGLMPSPYIQPPGEEMGVYLEEIFRCARPGEQYEVPFNARRFRPLEKKSIEAGMGILRGILEGKDPSGAEGPTRKKKKVPIK